MYTGSLGAISNREDWIAVSPLINEDDEEIDLTNADFEMFICDESCPSYARLSGSIDDGKITLPSSTTFQWHFTADDLGALEAKTYEVFLRVTIDDVVTQIISGSVTVVEGGPT